MSLLNRTMDRRTLLKISGATALGTTVVSLLPEQLFARSHWPQGPAGGPGGRWFQSDWVPAEARILSIAIRSGRRVDAIQIYYEYSDGRRSETPRYGGGGGGLQHYVFDRNEYLVGIEGTVGRGGKSTDRITSLRLHTSYGPSIPYGRGGGYNFSFDAPPEAEVIGLLGRSGRELDAVGVMLRQRG